jgi:hypothetical protein
VKLWARLLRLLKLRRPKPLPVVAWHEMPRQTSRELPVIEFAVLATRRSMEHWHAEVTRLSDEATRLAREADEAEAEYQERYGGARPRTT